MMFLAVDLPADLSPADRLLRAGLAGARRKDGNPYVRRDRLRVAQRLAGGLSPAQAARLEGCASATVEALLEQEGFRALVDAHAELEALTPDQRTARLVRLARLALENALSVDWDVGAACFVLDEHRHGRDPAVTVAEGAAKTAAAKRAPPGPAKPPGPLVPPAPLRPGHDPLAALVRRSTAALHQATLDEHALRRAAQAAGEEPAEGAVATAPAARRALELRAEAALAAWPTPDVPVPGEPAPGTAAESPGTPPEPHWPQRPRAP